MTVVLFVDDEPAVLEGLVRLLRRDRAVLQIVSASTTTEALKLLSSTHVDAVVSDLRMPGMDGAAFLAQVMVLAPHARRVLLTGTAEEVGTTTAHVVLAKPCSREGMLKALGMSGDSVGADAIISS